MEFHGAVGYQPRGLVEQFRISGLRATHQTARSVKGPKPLHWLAVRGALPTLRQCFKARGLPGINDDATNSNHDR